MTLTTDELPSEQSEGAPSPNDLFTASFKVDILSAKEAGDLGVVEAIVSAFDVDYVMGWRTKHRMTTESFVESIADNSTIPLFFQHNWSWSEQPPIGTAEASIEATGLKIAGSFFLDTEAGRSTFNAIKAKALREWSIGYRIVKYEVEEADDGFKTVIVKAADLMEASSVLRGANPSTETLKVAAVPAMLNEKLEELTDVLAMTVDLVNRYEKRLTAIETVHDMLVTSLEDGGFEASTGVPVEPADGGNSDAGADNAADQPQPAPGPPQDELVVRAGEVGSDRFDRAWDRAVSRIQSKWETYLEQAGAGLDGEEADPDSRKDIESMTRVVRCLNQTKAFHDAVEHRVTARILAESSAGKQ